MEASFHFGIVYLYIGVHCVSIFFRLKTKLCCGIFYATNHIMGFGSCEMCSLKIHLVMIYIVFFQHLTWMNTSTS